MATFLHTVIVNPMAFVVPLHRYAACVLVARRRWAEHWKTPTDGINDKQQCKRNFDEQEAVADWIKF